MAKVDLIVPLAHGATPDAPWGSTLVDEAIRIIRDNVRADDQVCPYGTYRIAITLGAGSDASTPRFLGERLARVIGQGLRDVQVIDERPSPRPDDYRALPSDPGAGGARATTVATPTTVVTVDSLQAGQRVGDAPPATVDGSPALLENVSIFRLRRRSVLHRGAAGPRTHGTRQTDDQAHDEGKPGGTVLVVDSGPSTSGGPGLAALAVSSLTERLGYTTSVLPLDPDSGPVTECGGTPVDLVLLMIGAEPDDRLSTWSSSTWCVPAELAGRYRALGIDVLAVGAGASLGPMIGCVEQGASVVLDLDELPTMLLSRRPGDTTGQSGIPPGDPGSSSRLDALLALTSSERRVLFHLTRGESAQDIADVLVVSLATVRSHIRSILRKLGVRSQLAAVALVNSRSLGGGVTAIAR